MEQLLHEVHLTVSTVVSPEHGLPPKYSPTLHVATQLMHTPPFMYWRAEHVTGDGGGGGLLAGPEAGAFFFCLGTAFLNILGLDVIEIEPFLVIALTVTSYLPPGSLEEKLSKTGDVVVSLMLFFPLRGVKIQRNFFQMPFGIATSSFLEEDIWSWSDNFGFGVGMGAVDWQASAISFTKQLFC